MRIRLAEPHEHPKLLSLKDIPWDAWVPDPRTGRVILAEDGGVVVGVLAVQWMPVMEPLWVAPAYRKSTLMGRLWKAGLKFLKSNGIQKFFSHVDNYDKPKMETYLQRASMKDLHKNCYEGTV